MSKCEKCLYNKNCQFLAAHKNADVEGCTAFDDKDDFVKVKHGHWVLLDDCANAGVYCSVCHKKVYKEQYANVKEKSKFCPNCGAKMDGGKENE